MSSLIKVYTIWHWSCNKKHVWFLLSLLIELRSLCYHTVPTCLGSLVWLKLTMHSFSLEIKTTASRTTCWALFGRPGWKICDQTSKYEESRSYRACRTDSYFRIVLYYALSTLTKRTDFNFSRFLRFFINILFTFLKSELRFVRCNSEFYDQTTQSCDELKR